MYGLGCDLFNKKAIDRLYQIKGIDKPQMLAFVCQNLGDVARYAVMHDNVYRVLKQFLPGPYCFILEATREVPKHHPDAAQDGRRAHPQAPGRAGHRGRARPAHHLQHRGPPRRDARTPIRARST